MAINPMQRKTRTAFLLGLILGLILLAFTAVGLYMMYDKKNKDYNNLAKKSNDIVYVAADSINALEEVTTEKLKKVERLKLSNELKASALDMSFFSGLEAEHRKCFAKINIPAGGIITKEMLNEVTSEEDKEVNSTLRIYDIAGISLPPDIKEKDVIDIRLQTPSGINFIVVSKKIIEKAEKDIIWVKLDEADIRTLSSALIESYLMTGSKIYATKYTDPGLQAKNPVNYPPNQEVINFIDNSRLSQGSGDMGDNKQMSEKFNQIIKRYNAMAGERNAISNAYSNLQDEEKRDKVQSGVQSEIRLKEEKREEYLEGLKSKE